MIAAMRKADSLSYVCHYQIRGKSNVAYGRTYRVWLKKPNYFRVDGSDKKSGGILIGDGNTLWVYWPKGRPRFMARRADGEDRCLRENAAQVAI